MPYGTYDRRLNDACTGDVALATVTAINLNGVAGTAILTKRVVEPITVDRFGYHPTTLFTYGTGPTTGYLGLYKYPFGKVCYDLATALWACNNLTAKMNAHAADALMHKTPDVANFPLPAVPVTDLAGMMVQVNLMQIAYAAHNADTQSGYVYHASDTTHALAASTAVTTLALTITKLLDILTKFNLHDLELTAHGGTYNNLHGAGKILLATIELVDGAVVGRNYFTDVDNLAVKALIPPYQGLTFKGVADFDPGDIVAIETKVMANGGTETGAFQPYFCDHVRAEETQNCPMAVDLTPVKSAATDNVVTDFDL